MLIDSIELFHVALPLKRPVQAAGREVDTLETVLLRMQCGELAGWGEASPGNGPLSGPDWAGGVCGCLRDWLAPAVVGQSIDSGDELAERLEPFHGNRFAKAALDTAWWDLEARRQDKSLPELLDARREAIEVGATFDRMESIDQFMADIAEAFQDGFARAKLKFRPGWDIHMVEAVRREFPAETLQVDCEGRLQLHQMELLHRLDDFGLEMVEQPLADDDLVGHAMIQESIRTAVCLDEGITTPAQAELALELKSCKYVNLKPGRVGGLTAAIAIHDACEQSEVGCYVGAMPQSAVGARLNLALAAKANCVCPADFFRSDRILKHDLAEPLLPRRDGPDDTLQVPLWSEPGIGIVPDADVLDKHCLARVRL